MDWLSVVHHIQVRFIPVCIDPSRDSAEFLPSSLPTLADDMEFVRTIAPEEAKFLDVGCGPGITLAMAESLGWNAWGIEHNEDLARFCGRKVFIQDALDFDGWSSFDIIFFYRPFMNRALELRLEHKIVEGMKPEAILIAYLPVSDLSQLRKLKQNVYRKPLQANNLLTKPD